MASEPRSSHVARVVARRDAGAAMTLLAFDIPDAIRESYSRPGQYASFTCGSDEGYFVLGSRERRAPWEILLRGGGGVADSLLSSSRGAIITVSPALGEGFPVEAAHGHDVIVVVTAGAIGAARATVGRRIDDGDAARTRLIVGARTAHAIPLADELAEMRRAGVGVRIVLSSRAEALPTFDRGYVQHALEREPLSNDANAPWIFVAGAPAMIEGVKLVASARGVPTDKVVSNT